MEEEEEDDELRSPFNKMSSKSKSYRPLTEDDLSFRDLSTVKTRPTSTDAAAFTESSSAELQSTTV